MKNSLATSDKTPVVISVPIELDLSKDQLSEIEDAVMDDAIVEEGNKTTP